MKRSTAPLLFVAATSVLAFWTGCATKPVTHTATAAGNGSTVKLTTGDFLQVQLEANPSTGFSWQTLEINSWVLARTERPDFKPTEATTADGNPRVGSGGILTLDFRAVGPGTAPLKLAYFQPWESNVPPAQTFELTVDVE